MYTHPHVHSDYSNYGMLDSINRIENIIKRVKELEQTSWCLTDHNTCSGLVDAYKQSKKAGLKFIPGTELYLTYDLKIQQRDLHHITFWAKTDEGLENLYKMTSEAHGDKGRSPKNYYYKSRVDLDLIRKYSKGLMVGTACLGGFLWKHIETSKIIIDDNGNPKEIVEVSHVINEEPFHQLIDIFGNDNVFIELHTYQCEEQYQYNRKLVELSKTYNIPLIAATDAHFTLKEDAELRRLFKNTSKEQDTSEHVDDTLYLQSEDEIRENLKYLPSDIVEQSLANTQILADKSNVTIEFGKKYYPEYPCDNPLAEIKKQCQIGWKNRGIGKYPDARKYVDRLTKVEMPIIEKQGYAPYFLITAELYKFGREHRFPIPPGRGSAVASLILWLMGVTQLDPIKYNCIFERFAHMERISPPDIDNDLSRKHRGEYIKHTQDLYGEVYPCRTFSTVGAGKAIGIAGKALGYSPQEIIEISKLLSKYESDDEDEDISTFEQKIWMLDNIKTEENTELIELAKKFVGIIFGFSKHASALIVLNEDINKFCSVERQIDTATKEPCYVAACNFKYLEEMGLMKLDMLGLKTLDVVSDTVDLLPEPLDIMNIPLDDKETSEMLIQGHTKGCFQISSPGMTQLVKQIRPREYKDLIPLVALYRPGPLNATVESRCKKQQEYLNELNEYLESEASGGNKSHRKEIEKAWPKWVWNGGTLLPNDVKEYTMVQTYIGVKNWTELSHWVDAGNSYESWEHWNSVTTDEIIAPVYLHPKLEPILKDTYSIILYQEQILEIAKQLCGYSLGEADMLRRIIGKKKVDEMKPALETMIQRGVDNGIPQDVMQKITHQIVEFASYCFNKGHSAGYGYLAYQTAYLKAHYPLEFLCSCINNEHGVQKKILPFIKECKRINIEVLPPNLSKGNTEWIIEGSSIRVGLQYIKDIGKNLNTTPNDSFMSIVGANNKGVTEALIKAGALDYLGHPRGLLLSNLTTLQDIIKRGEQCEQKIAENKQKLSEATTEKDKRKYERQLKSWEQKLAEVQTTSAQQESGEFDEIAGECEVLGFSFQKIPRVKLGTLQKIYKKNDKTGSEMAWLTMVSSYGEFRCTCFAKGWSKVKSAVKQGENYEFVVNDDGILQEIKIGESVVNTNERKRW